MRTLWLVALFAAAVGASPDDEARARRLAEGFVAPCCWQEALSSHRSPAADEARAELAVLVEQGKSDAEIREAFKARYGSRILIVPEGGAADLLFWAPAAFLALGTVGAGLFLHRLRRRTRMQPAADGPLAEIDQSEIDW